MGLLRSPRNKPTLYSGYIATSQGPAAGGAGATDTTFGDLVTSGPAVTLVVGPAGTIQVSVGAHFFQSIGSSLIAMSYAISGATTRAALDDDSIAMSIGNSQRARKGRTSVVTGLTPGSTITVTAKYKCISSNPISERSLSVIAF